MAVATVDYAANQPTASAQETLNTERGPSESIWAPTQNQPNAGPADFLQDPRLGMLFYDDFLVAGNCAVGISLPNLAALTLGSIGNWAFIAPAGGGFADAGIVGGGLQIGGGSLAIASTNQTTEVIYSNVGAFQIQTASSSGLQGRLAFEARLALTSVTNGKRDVFVGLIDQAPASTAALQALFPFTQAGSSTNNLTSTYNLIGFYFPSASVASAAGRLATPSGDCNFVFQLASTAPVFCSNLGGLVSNITGTAIAAGTFYKLGFIFDPNALPANITVAGTGQTVGNNARKMLRVFVNGVESPTFLTAAQNIQTASFPTGIMGPIVAISPTSSGTGNTASTQAGFLNLDWLRVMQTGLT